MGTSYQNGECANGARMAVLDAGWPDTVPGVVIDRRCCSGLESIFYGALQIQTGNAEIIVAGGMDSMSQAELYIPGDIKWGLGGKSHEKYGFMPRGHGALAMWGIPLYDRLQRGRVMSQPIHRYGELNSMMSWAEMAAKREKITREEADKWAYRSHKRAIAAWDAGKFANEIVPVPVGKGKDGDMIFFNTDEGPRRKTTMEKLAKLRPVYPDGVCTAGNSSSENDGASVVVLASERKATELGIKPMAYFRSCAIAATDPTLTYPAVPVAVSRALSKAALKIDRSGIRVNLLGQVSGAPGDAAGAGVPRAGSWLGACQGQACRRRRGVYCSSIIPPFYLYSSSCPCLVVQAAVRPHRIPAQDKLADWPWFSRSPCCDPRFWSGPWCRLEY